MGILRNDEKVAGLESLLNYLNENFVAKDDPAINEHHYHITKKQSNEDIQNIRNIDKSKSYNIKNHRYTDDHYYNKKLFINNSIINNITKKNIINKSEKVLNLKDYSYKTYITNSSKSQTAYVENNLYKKQDSITFNNTTNIYKHINQYSTDVFNNCKIIKHIM